MQEETGDNAAFLPVEYDLSKTQKGNLKCLCRKTFKQILIMNKRISIKLVEEMIGNDLKTSAQNLVLKYKKQRGERKGGEILSTFNEPSLNLRYFPNL